MLLCSLLLVDLDVVELVDIHISARFDRTVTDGCFIDDALGIADTDCLEYRISATATKYSPQT